MTKCSGDRCVYIYMYICTLETYIHWRDGEYTNPFFALSSKGTEKKKKQPGRQIYPYHGTLQSCWGQKQN